MMPLPSTSLLDTRLADIVTADPRVTPVLDRLGLDYCCRGHRTLHEAALDHSVPVSEILGELAALGPRPEGGGERREWKNLAGLVEHIVTVHHGYVREHEPILHGWLEKLAGRHGAKHPELHNVRAVFDELAHTLLQHMEKEEKILFPFIKTLWAAHESGQLTAPSPFGTIVNPVRAMEHEHREAGELLAGLRRLTSGYEPPAGGCTTYRACYAELARFEADLHQHVHLENHVLFPGAVALECALG
jgi:regulator of cell morphogenesis and NO signaling